MRKMLAVDYLAIGGLSLWKFILLFISGLLLTLAAGSSYPTIPLIIFITSFSIALSVISSDKMNNWQTMRLTLPLSRREVVTGRYLGVFLSIVLGLILGLILTGLLFLFCPMLGQIQNFLGFSNENSLPTVLGLFKNIVSTVSLTILFFAIGLPFSMQFGPKGLCVPFIIGAVFPTFFSIMVIYPEHGTRAYIERILPLLPLTLQDSLVWMLTTPKGHIVAFTFLLVLSICAYILSCLLSVKLYSKRNL